MKEISAIFDRLDHWKKLPSYQLERRADIFFSLYLPEALESALIAPASSRSSPPGKSGRWSSGQKHGHLGSPSEIVMRK